MSVHSFGPFSLGAWCLVGLAAASCGKADHTTGAQTGAGDSGAGSSGGFGIVGGGTGSDGAAGGSGSGGSGGGACPLYQSLCNGTCIPHSMDPDNCGGCGVKCTGNQVCSGGACSTGCLPGLTVCNRACVDAQNDNANCGACNRACASNQGCVAGACVDGMSFGPSPAKCAHGGSAVSVTGVGCLGQLAQTTFTWALCSCKDINLMSSGLITDAFDSTRGPYMPGGLGGGVGLNGSLSSTSSNEIWGALWASSGMGVTSDAPNVVKQELHVGGPLTTSSTFTVGEDGYVADNVATTGSIAIAKTLYLPAGKTITGNVTSASVVRQPVTVPPPCACAPSQLIPVASIVAGVASNNDDSAIGLNPAMLASPLGHSARLDLPCGVYYLSGIDQQGQSVTIAAHGHTAVFVDGDVIGEDVSFVLDPNGELDVFVAGTISAMSGLTVGSPNYPALSRTYIGGTSTFILTGNPQIGGNVYAAHGPVLDDTNNTVYGALYAGDFQSSSNVGIHYDRAVLQQGNSCGHPPNGCGTCRDCGNQACINGTCGACTSSAQCCPPLECHAGQCVAFTQ